MRTLVIAGALLFLSAFGCASPFGGYKGAVASVDDEEIAQAAQEDSSFPAANMPGTQR